MYHLLHLIIPVAYPGWFFGCPETPLPWFLSIMGVTPLLAPIFTSLLNLRLLETPLETNSGYATAFHHKVSLSPRHLRPAVILNTSCPTLKIVLLLSSHDSCTLSTGLTFSNTVFQNFILESSSYILHHFVIGVACSGGQRCFPSLLHLTWQFWVYAYNHTLTILCRTQLLIHICYQNVSVSFSILHLST